MFPLTKIRGLHLKETFIGLNLELGLFQPFILVKSELFLNITMFFENRTWYLTGLSTMKCLIQAST